MFFFVKQQTASEMRISDWSSDGCSSDRERSVERVIEVPFESEGYSFRMVIYRNLIDGAEHVALVKGQLATSSPALVRVHSVDLATDLFRHSGPRADRSEEHTSELQSLMRISYAVFCLKKKTI